MPKVNSCSTRICLKSLLFTMVMSLTFSPAHGGVIGTQQALQVQQGMAAKEQIQTFLARQDAQAALIRMGVDPEQAMARVTTLTPEEAEQLAQKIGDLPAGSIGLIEVIGITAVVLLILELLGVTNIFTNF